MPPSSTTSTTGYQLFMTEILGQDRMLMHNALTNFVRLVSFHLLSITKKQCLIRYSSCSVMYEEPTNLPHPVTKKFLIE
ncbi:hypothetical protein SAY86_004711 [Trapa natans]|uniref:Uncharacterized protein n=1 Tax=Trapa natans TaxID=22666 RepID=A0AAN7MG08_TRANT|nr:hypothetical protein SAY86_004711 [Trapa natans]